MSEEKKRLGLTPAEFDHLLTAIRYGVIIVITVLLTFLVVASVSNMLGYTPPSPRGSQAVPTLSQTAMP